MSLLEGSGWVSQIVLGYDDEELIDLPIDVRPVVLVKDVSRNEV